MLKNLWTKVVSSAKEGGITYFLAAILLVSVRLVIDMTASELDIYFREFVLWVVTMFVSLLIVVPFMIVFNAFTENRWGWKHKLAKGIDYMVVAAWIFLGAVFAVFLWWLGFVIF